MQENLEYRELTPCFLVIGEYVPVADCEEIHISEDMFGCDTFDFRYKGQFYFSYLHHKEINK